MTLARAFTRRAAPEHQWLSHMSQISSPVSGIGNSFSKRTSSQAPEPLNASTRVLSGRRIVRVGVLAAGARRATPRVPIKRPRRVVWRGMSRYYLAWRPCGKRGDENTNEMPNKVKNSLREPSTINFWDWPVFLTPGEIRPNEEVCNHDSHSVRCLPYRIRRRHRWQVEQRNKVWRAHHSEHVQSEKRRWHAD